MSDVIIIDAPSDEIDVSPEILAAAEEIAAGSDVLGLEPSRLELLVRTVLILDRSK
jgi:hypothetical protein